MAGGGPERVVTEYRTPNADQQADDNGDHSFPYGPNAVQVDEQHVQVNEDFDHNDCGIQNAICIKNERDWHGERRKPVAKSTIYKGGHSCAERRRTRSAPT